MAQPQAPYGTLTLQAALEAVARLGAEYCIGWKADDWTAENLLAWLSQEAPIFLSMEVYLVLPAAGSDGAIYGIDSAGDPIPAAYLYRIKRRQPTFAPS